jgi:Helix-turn-helix domain
MIHERYARHGLRLTARERRHLEAMQRMTTLPAGVMRRARVILLVADGLPMQEITRKVGMQPRHINKWLRRYEAQGLDGLDDKPRQRRAQAAVQVGKNEGT